MSLNTGQEVPTRRHLGRAIEHQMYGAGYHAAQIADGTERPDEDHLALLESRIEVARRLIAEIRQHRSIREIKVKAAEA